MGEDSEDNGKKKIVVYQLNDEKAEFEELDFDEDLQLYELLDPSFVLLFLDPSKFRAWIWQGSETSVRMKFLSAKLAGAVRDSIGIAMKLSTVDDGNEPLAFKIMVGLEEEETFEEVQTGPSYTGTVTDNQLLKEATLEQIIALLEKLVQPRGFKRDLVIVKNKIYKYVIDKTEYMGSVVEQKKLLPLEEKIPDGPYLIDGYTPRLLFSFNNIVIIELLKRMTPEEIEKEDLLQEKIMEVKKQMEEE